MLARWLTLRTRRDLFRANQALLTSFNLDRLIGAGFRCVPETEHDATLKQLSSLQMKGPSFGDMEKKNTGSPQVCKEPTAVELCVDTA